MASFFLLTDIACNISSMFNTYVFLEFWSAREVNAAGVTALS